MIQQKFLLICLFVPFFSLAQQDASKDNDTFFLARKRGIIGKLARSITRDNFPDADPVQVALPYQQYNGWKIHSVEIMPLGFNHDVYDTNHVKQNIGIRIANAFHKNTRESVIRRNVFFKKGDTFYALLVSDNERFLREQPFLQDALIVVYPASMLSNEVDVIVLTRDVFSIGISGSASNTSRIRGEIKEENLGGYGNRLSLTALYDKDRRPGLGAGIEYTQRAMRKKWVLFNWTTGLTTFNPAIVNGRNEEYSLYTVIEKPFITRYTEWTGSASVAYHLTSDAYKLDTTYKNYDRYRYVDADAWIGYNMGFGRKKSTDNEKRIRHFFGMRGFYTRFHKIPDYYETVYNYNYANIRGGLMQYSIYRQNYYKTKFIYGFGRNEDVPIGFRGGATYGWTNKQGVERWYQGVDFEYSYYAKRGFYSLYTARFGGFKPPQSRMEDISLLLSVDHFTKIRWLNPRWLNRNFVSISYSKQIHPSLNAPLVLQSEFGMPYSRVNAGPAEERTTVKLESVFYHTQKLIGFRFAPFAFTDVSFLRPVGESFGKTNGYPAFGAGVRTRNENLIFGTIELRGYVFPRTTPGVASWKVEFSTNIRFRYTSSFIRKPDFVLFN